MAQWSFGIYAAPHYTTIHQKQIPYDWTIQIINENTHSRWGAGMYLKVPLTDFLYLKNETGYSQNVTSIERVRYHKSEYIQSGLLAGYIPFYKRNDLLKGLSFNAGTAIKYKYSGHEYFYNYKKAPDIYYSLLLGASFNYKILTLSPFADISLTPYQRDIWRTSDFRFFFRNYGLKLSCKVF
jgi:hypothetical protein